MAHVNPPYRADIVGSFLRPEAVKEARIRFAAGLITKDELTAIENEAIRDLVAKEKANGLKAVTDGEFRRHMWHLDFLAELTGIQHVKAQAWSVQFKGHQPNAETIVIADKIAFPKDHSFLAHFDFLKEAAGDTPVKASWLSCWL